MTGHSADPKTFASPPIGDYGFIADCHSVALVSKEGSIDWCCMPRIDSRSCFGRLLGWEKGGFWRIAPVDPFRASRRYLDDTLILETRFVTGNGEVRLIDCFPMRMGGRKQPYQQLLRIVEGIGGEVRLGVEFVPRFDYGAIKPWIREYGDGCFTAIGGCDGLFINGDVQLDQADRHSLTGVFVLGAGERRRLSVLYRRPEQLGNRELDPLSNEELDRRLVESVTWWKNWAAQGNAAGPGTELVRRSAVVLKGLSNAPTGAIAAAATTSLPEVAGGSRNWDYRYTWIRDSVFAIRSLAELGYLREADGFRRFIERSAAGSAEELQVLFGVGGERRLEEHKVADLGGYRGAKPVRIGNAAARQVQLDIYGELLDLAWRWHQGGRSPDDDYWEFLVESVGEACRNWLKPDRGIWEIRGEPRHFVFSKVMCWSAVDKGIRLAEELGRTAPLGDWRKARDTMRSAVEAEGYERERGVFVQHFGGRGMDAALLLIPVTGFVAFDDPRMIRTVDAVRLELTENGMLRRYTAGSDSPLRGREGVFIACSFWLAECLARQGRMDEAEEVFARAVSTGNDLGLYAEEFDPLSRTMLGNFPQGLTHLSHISAAMALGVVNRVTK